MESSLEVLSRAVTMIQDSEVEKLTTKDKQIKRHIIAEKAIKDTQHHPLENHHYIKQRGMSAAPAMHNEAPLDMTIASKNRRTPPPPYPYKQIEMTKAARPSVITKAPRIISHHHHAHHMEVVVAAAAASNNGNDSYLPQQQKQLLEQQQQTDSISMCDTVIDEHFRRSLGNNYIALLTNEKTNKMIKLEVPSPPSTAINDVATPPPPPVSVTPTRSTPPVTPVAAPAVVVAEIVPDADHYVTANPPPPPPVVEVVTHQPSNNSDDDDDNEISVDDHFAKALGNDMWKKIQEKSLKS